MWLIAFMHDYGGSGSLSCKRASRPSLPLQSRLNRDPTSPSCPFLGRSGTTTFPPTSLSEPATHSHSPLSFRSTSRVPTALTSLSLFLFLPFRAPPSQRTSSTSFSITLRSFFSCHSLLLFSLSFLSLSISVPDYALSTFADIFLISFTVRFLSRANLFQNSMKNERKRCHKGG